MPYKFNIFTNKFDIVNTATSTTNFADNEIPTGSGTTFTLAHTPNPSTSLSLYRGGALQEQGGGNDYTISGNTITLAVALVSGEILLANYRY